MYLILKRNLSEIISTNQKILILCSDGRVTSICEDKDGMLWIGTWDGGLNKWDRTSNKFIRYKNNPR